MDIFQRINKIETNLEGLTMERIMNFPIIEHAGSEEFYLKEVFSPNHIQIGVVQSKSYTSGIHDFEYDIKTKEIKIFSRFKKAAFLLYGYLIMPIYPLIDNQNGENNLEWLGITIALFLFLTLILILGIKSESKEIEREMIIRINYLRRTGNA